jgi:ubiquinone/menaquinone biosynthesis C-methylase UbiE
MPRKAEPELMDDRAEAEAYAKADFAEVNQAFADRLLEIVGPAGKAEALDLGTGPGDIPLRLLRARPGWHIVAVDASQAMLELAKRAVEAAGASSSIDLVLADAKATKLPPRAFDIVFSNSILHHISEADRFWAEIKRVGRPGATVFLRDLYRPATLDAARDIVDLYAGSESTLLRDEYYRSLLAAYTPGEVRGQIARAGLATLRVETVTDRHMDIYGRI